MFQMCLRARKDCQYLSQHSHPDVRYLLMDPSGSVSTRASLVQLLPAPLPPDPPHRESFHERRLSEHQLHSRAAQHCPPCSLSAWQLRPSTPTAALSLSTPARGKTRPAIPIFSPPSWSSRSFPSTSRLGAPSQQPPKPDGQK